MQKCKMVMVKNGGKWWNMVKNGQNGKNVKWQNDENEDKSIEGRNASVNGDTSLPNALKDV